MRKGFAIGLASVALASTLAFGPAFAQETQAAETRGAQSPICLTTQQTDADPALATMGSYMNFKFTYNAYLTNGKGSAYKSYLNMRKIYGSNAITIIRKARIKGSKLYLTGTITKMSTGKTVKLSNKAYALTSKTKYYRHIGNNSYCEKITKNKMKKLLSSKSKSSGGDIGFILKGGKIKTLVAQ